jgi:antitoxin component YwqK of YwqJK toxin-antitoxin module
MKITTLLFFFMFILNSSLFSQISYDNGSTFYTDSSQTMLCNGKFRKFYPGLKIKSSTSFLKGKLDGESIEYFENGQVFTSLNYSNGLLEGEALEFYPETLVIKSKFHFSKGLKNGECITYDESGDIVEKLNFINGVIQE